RGDVIGVCYRARVWLFFFQADDGIRDDLVTGVQTCALPISIRQVQDGGALMALADTVGAAATILNLPDGASTTTLESKTNFFAENGRASCRERGEELEVDRGRHQARLTLGMRTQPSG